MADIEIALRVPPDCGGMRLDLFLRRRIPRLSRARIQTIISGQVALPGGRRARPSSIVRSGQTVLLRRPEPFEPPVPRHFDLLYEDEHLICVDKPACLPIHTTAKFFRNTLTALLRERFPGEIADVAHRLDRETSGVLLVARTAAARTELKRAFARRKVEKYYLALVHGQPPDQGTVTFPLKLLPTCTRIMMGVSADGAPGSG